MVNSKIVRVWACFDRCLAASLILLHFQLQIIFSPWKEYQTHRKSRKEKHIYWTLSWNNDECCNGTQRQETFLRTCSPSEDLRSLIRMFPWCILDSQSCIVSSWGQPRLWSECAEILLRRVCQTVRFLYCGLYINEIIKEWSHFTKKGLPKWLKEDAEK